MKKIAHRINNISDISLVPLDVGLEFDVHSYLGELVITHDPMNGGELLRNFLLHTEGRFCAINIKQEGIEESTISLALKYLGANNFYLFDVTMPQIVRLGPRHRDHLAIRVSQIEKPDIKYLSSYASHVWLDTFDGTYWPCNDEIKSLLSLNYSITFVSPELHKPPLGSSGKYIEDLFANLEEELREYTNRFYICTKRFQLNHDLG